MIILVDVDTEKLYDILRTNKYTQVDEDYDNDEINIEDCNRYDEEKDNFDWFAQHECVIS